MGSNVLPQALLLVPRYRSQCQSNNLSFSTTISPRFSSFSSNPRVSLRAFGSNLSPIVAELAKRSFVVRAESSSDSTENVEDKEDVVDEEETELEAEVKSEEEEEEEEAKVKTPRKPRIKLGDIMGILNKRAIEASEKERPVPDIRTGDVVEIKLEVPENRRRASTYKGIVISKQNAGIHTTIRIRRIIAGIGVEIVFPVYSPNIKELKVVSHRKVRRARLYYLRDKLPRLSTFK